VGVALALAFLVGVIDGVGDAVGGEVTGLEPGVVMITGSVPPIFVGFGNCRIGSPLRAPFINAVQIFAGKVPPVTEFNPPIPFKL
jgi:hypothetical protein